MGPLEPLSLGNGSSADLKTSKLIPVPGILVGQRCMVQRFSEILQHKSKSGSYVLANQNADFKSRFELVLEHAHESSL